MTRKITVGAMISVSLLSLRCAFWYAFADSSESTMALLEDLLEVATIYFISKYLFGGRPRGPKIPGSGLLTEQEFTSNGVGML